MSGLRDLLHDSGLLARITVPPEINTLLEALEPSEPVWPGDDVRGTARFVVAASPLGFLSLSLTPPTPDIPFHLVTDATEGSFRLWLVINEVAPAKAVFGFVTGATGTVLRAAEVKTDGRQEWLEPVAGRVSLTGVGVAVLVEGEAGGAATVRVVPGDGAGDGLVTLGLDPPTVLLGDSGFGLDLPNGLTIDESTERAAAGRTVVAGRELRTDADDPAWRGLLARAVRFFVPRSVGVLGGHGVDAYVSVGTEPAGIDVAVATRWEPDDGGPAVEVLIECHDPSARGLQDFVPTLVETAVTLPVQESVHDVGGSALTVTAGRPVVARVRFARSSTDPTTRMTFGLESQGGEGIVSVHAPDGGVPAKAVIAAGALATAMVADEPPAGADASGSGLHSLLVAALALSTMLKDHGRLTVNGVELESTGGGLPVGGAVRFKVDYSVDVLVRPISVGVLCVEMRDEQPMRVRNRNVLLTYDPTQAGLDRFRLDFSKSGMEIEDPGAWHVDGPASLFDVLGSRSGRGSMWLEVDLRFKVNLGPVSVSGATIRATRGDDGGVTASMRGLDASLDVPGVFNGRGAFQLEPAGGFGAELDVALVPLNLSAGATLFYRPQDGGFFLRLAADLPGPIPLANSGFGLYGVAGSFGYGVRPALPPPGHPDPVGFQLAWDSGSPDESPDESPNAWTSSPGDVTVGAELVLGTLPDLGFSLSAKGGLFLTVPDLAVRGALWGRLLGPRMRVTDHPSDADEGLSLRGVVVVDSHDGVTIGLEGRYVEPALLDVRVPLGAHFPSVGDASQWFVNLGADGFVNPVRVDGRSVGPIRAKVLPGLAPTEAEAYLMLQGHGLDRWPRGEPGAMTIPDGFVLAFGFGFQDTIGIQGVVWADIHARLDVLLATRPLTLAGFGNVGGSLNLGPFSIGVDADLKFLVAENADDYVHARLCGRIDLFFTEIEGCVEISVNNPPQRAVPPPDVHPLDDVQSGQIVGDLAYAIDDGYRRLASLARTPEAAADRPVWPDTLLHLSFARSPRLAPGFSRGQFASVEHYPTGVAAQPVGSSMLSYDWDLTHLTLSDVTGDPHGPGTLVPGPLSGAWQVGKDGDPGVRPQAGDLVLLTYQGDLWLNRLADAGERLPDDPLGAAGSYCKNEPDPGPTWVVGWGARGAAGLLDLPPDPVHTDARLTPWTATLLRAWSEIPYRPLGVFSAAELAPELSYLPPTFTPGNLEPVLERPFDGILELGGLTAVADAYASANTAVIVPSEPIADGRLWVAFEMPRDVADDAVVVQVTDDRENSWTVTETRALADGRTAMRFAPRAPDPVRRVRIDWWMGHRLGLFGLGGVGEAAVQARQARRDARALLAGVQQQAAMTQPQPAGTTTGQGARCLLQPGRLYRLDVGMTWSGRLYEQQEHGGLAIVDTAFDQSTYCPGGGADPTTSRSYFVQTTHRSAPGGVVPAQGTPHLLALLLREQASFAPEMLLRHLAGYTPAQSEPFRFCDDPLQAHFRVAHIATLAAAYGFALRLGIRRVDAPGAEGEEQFPSSSLVKLALPELLGHADWKRYLAARGAPCAMPVPGATLEALTPLAPQAWYEVFVDVPRTGGGHGGRLPGTTFGTSRWRDPTDMLRGLGLGVMPTAASGDHAVQLPVGRLAEQSGRSDAVFQHALAQLGLDGWPVTDSPRTSLLWTRTGDGVWGIVGLLLESPEPVARPGRLDLSNLHGLDGALSTQVTVSDRTFSRLMFLADTPVVPAAPSTVTLDLQDRLSGSPVSGSLVVPAAPQFAAEP